MIETNVIDSCDLAVPMAAANLPNNQQNRPDPNENDEKKEQMALPLQILSIKLPDNWSKQLESEDFELRKNVKRQARDLVSGDQQGCSDVLRLYVCT